MENQGASPDPVKKNVSPDSAITPGLPPGAPDSSFVAGPPPAAPEETPTTLTQWLTSNGILLLLVAVAVGFLLYKFDMSALLLVALGLTFVIFIHELGHFLVAKWCDVHVTTFSIGFGPAIPGCAWKRGETTYKLSLIPLGGYVQMVGQVDGDEASDGSEDDPRSYRNKTVGQRMAIISAGVIMNVILAIACFVIVFDGPGKDRPAAVVGNVDTDSPAFRQGLRTGAVITQIGDVKNPNFEQLMTTVMSSEKGEKIALDYQLPGHEPVDLLVEPRMGKQDKRPVIGMTNPVKAELLSRRMVERSIKTPTVPGSAADLAQPAFAFGDRIVATTDPAHPDQVTPLPDDPRAPADLHQKDYFEFARRMQLLADQPVTIVVERGENAERVSLVVQPQYRRTLGVRMQMGKITSIRHGSPAEKAGVHGPRKGTRVENLSGDEIEAVTVTEPDGTTKTFRDKTLDPERLPYQLKEWAGRMGAKGVKAPWQVTLVLNRHRDEPGPQAEKVEVKLDWDNAWRFDRALPVYHSSPLAISELGLAYQISTTVAEVVDPSSPLKAGDVIKNIRRDVQGPTKEVNEPWYKPDLEDNQWALVSQQVLQSPYTINKLQLKVQRGKGNVQEIDFVPPVDKTWPLTDRGWLLTHDMRRQKADGIFEAIGMGLKDTQNNMLQVFQNLRGIATGRISIDNLGGPMTIAAVAYRFALLDVWEFIFFLGLISVNLAVVNFLPIPVLDGGHMVFLLYEKLSGRPASEGVRVAATVAGLALILCLIVFVSWLDITRLFFS